MCCTLLQYFPTDGQDMPLVYSAGGYLDRNFSSANPTYNDNMVSPFLVNTTLRQIKVKILSNTLGRDAIMYVTKNGLIVYTIKIKTTDNGTLDFYPNIYFDEGDDMGFFFPADTQTGNATFTLVYSMENDC